MDSEEEEEDSDDEYIGTKLRHKYKSSHKGSD